MQCRTEESGDISFNSWPNVAISPITPRRSACSGRLPALRRPHIENWRRISLVMSRNSALVRVFFCLGLFAVAAISAGYLRKSRLPALGEAPRIEYPSEIMAQSARQQFLEGSFSFIKNVKNLPAPVLRAFTEQGGSRLVMADPGKDFRATDVIHDSTLPSKRLIFAGVSGDKCFVHYEQGGIGLSYVLALFNVISKDSMKPIWRGYCGRRATNLEDLRSWLADGSCSQP